MKIIKRDGEELVFDTSKIVAAITKALDLFAGVAAEISELAEEMERNLCTALHSLAHWITQCFSSIGRKLRKKLHFSFCGTVCLVPVISACVKILNLVAGVISCKTRATYLLRTQDRGSSDSDSDNRMIMIAV